MLGTNDFKNGTSSYILGKFRTLILISNPYKSLCFSFEAFRAVKLIQQIVANLNSCRFKANSVLSYSLRLKEESLKWFSNRFISSGIALLMGKFPFGQTFELGKSVGI